MKTINQSSGRYDIDDNPGRDDRLVPETDIEQVLLRTIVANAIRDAGEPLLRGDEFAEYKAAWSLGESMVTANPTFDDKGFARLRLVISKKVFDPNTFLSDGDIVDGR